MKPKIYSIFYLPNRVITDDDLYEPLICGNYQGKEVEKYLTDHTGDHLADKNKVYSELTAIYWIWKNTQQDIIGVCHYRRYYTCIPEPWYHKVKNFVKHPFHTHTRMSPLIYTTNVEKYRKKILNKQELLSILSQYDAILPARRIFRYSVKEHYRKYHDLRDLQVLEGVIQDLQPDYMDAYDSVLKGNVLFANNMFVLKNEEFQRFMSWWFELIFEFEKRVNTLEYTGYQERIIGFIAERLLTVWFKKENLKCKELQLIYFKKFKNKSYH
jgi:hypothetical protein